MWPNDSRPTVASIVNPGYNESEIRQRDAPGDNLPDFAVMPAGLGEGE